VNFQVLDPPLVSCLNPYVYEVGLGSLSILGSIFSFSYFLLGKTKKDFTLVFPFKAVKKKQIKKNKHNLIGCFFQNLKQA
jgi:hypothetical protein